MSDWLTLELLRTTYWYKQMINSLERETDLKDLQLHALQSMYEAVEGRLKIRIAELEEKLRSQEEKRDYKPLFMVAFEKLMRAEKKVADLKKREKELDHRYLEQGKEIDQLKDELNMLQQHNEAQPLPSGPETEDAVGERELRGLKRSAPKDSHDDEAQTSSKKPAN